MAQKTVVVKCGSRKGELVFVLSLDVGVGMKLETAERTMHRYLPKCVSRPGLTKSQSLATSISGPRCLAWLVLMTGETTDDTSSQRVPTSTYMYL